MNIKYLIFFIIFNKTNATNRKVKIFEPQTVAQKLKQLDELYFLVHKRVMESNRIAQQTLSDVKILTSRIKHDALEANRLNMIRILKTVQRKQRAPDRFKRYRTIRNEIF